MNNLNIFAGLVDGTQLVFTGAGDRADGLEASRLFRRPVEGSGDVYIEAFNGEGMAMIRIPATAGAREVGSAWLPGKAPAPVDPATVAMPPSRPFLSNLTIGFVSDDGMVSDFIVCPGYYMTGRETISAAFTDDWGAPPQSVEIETSLADGRVLAIGIPCDTRSTAAYIRMTDGPLPRRA